MIAAICDDDRFFRTRMHTFLVEYKKRNRIHLDIVEFSTGDELLASESSYDIVFLDYDMPGVNGMEVARMLRQKKSFCCIVFATSFPEHVFDAFEVNAYRYLVKPIDPAKLAGVLDTYIKERKQLSPITLNVEGTLLTIKSEDIIYLEAAGKYCLIRKGDDCLRSSKTLSKTMALLPQHCFFRTHKSYAVNFHWISSIYENIAILRNGEKIQISRSNIAAFKKAYKEFLKHLGI